MPPPSQKQDLKIEAAAQALAHFLRLPREKISCELLTNEFHEAVVLKCTSHAQDYVIKYFTSEGSSKNEIAWAQHAFNLGIGPKLYLADPSAHFMIMELARGDSLIPTRANNPSTIKNIALSIRLLHNSIIYFGNASDIITQIENKYKNLKSSNSLAILLEKTSDHLEKIKYRFNKISVSNVPCHMDLSPGNIFSTNDEITLIDWGDVALSNPYYEIAAFFVLNSINQANQHLFLAYYTPQLSIPDFNAYMKCCKRLIYLEFALNLLLGVQAKKSELLHMQFPIIKDISYYLALLAEKQETLDVDLLYKMALASLHEFLYG